MFRRLLLSASVLAVLAGPASALEFINAWTIPGAATDLSGLGAHPNQSRQSIGSDLTYDRKTGTFYGVTDRGPGGGLVDFAPRAHAFQLGIDPSSGAIGSYNLTGTVVFKDGANTFTGLNPTLANGTPTTLGRSFDSEGIARLKNGNLLISDEYGPSIKEFTPDGQLVRDFTTPANLLPTVAGGAANYTDGRPTIVNGRQDNRGFEGLTLSPDGKTAYAILQDPLVNEGAGADGRQSRNLRIVAYDVATGQSTSQFAYQLEDRAAINARITAQGSSATFSASNQGRSIGVSSITALGDGKFLVIERDNRGVGVEDPLGLAAVGSKRVYLIDITGASDIAGVSLAGVNALPGGVTPVSKTLFLDVQAALAAAGLPIPEKFEGLAFGPAIDGGLSLILATDNDFSVTQTGTGEQFDVCTSGVGAGQTFAQVAIGAGCPSGMALLPTYVYAFKVSYDELAAFGVDGRALAAVPEPATWAMMILGLGAVGAAMRRSRRTALGAG